MNILTYKVSTKPGQGQSRRPGDRRDVRDDGFMGGGAQIGFVFNEPRAGWMDVTVEHGASVNNITVSYETDALPNLLNACLGLLGGNRTAEIDWAGEPRIYRWAITRTGRTLDVRLDMFEDNPDLYPGQPSSELLHAGLDLIDFCRSVAAAASILLSNSGEERYLRGWLDHFPTTQLRAIERRVLSRGPATFFLGREGDSVTIEVGLATEEDTGFACGIEVHSRDFTATVATSVRFKALSVFNDQLGELCRGHHGEAVLTTTDGSCHFAVLRPSGGGRARLNGVVADDAGRALTLSVPIQNQDIDIMRSRASEAIRLLNEVNPDR